MEWWKDNKGGALKVSFVKKDDFTMCLFFDKSDKLVEAYIDQPLDVHSDDLLDEAAAYYGKYNKNDEWDKNFFESFWIDDPAVGFDLFTQEYPGDYGDVCFRQNYWLWESMGEDAV